MRTLQDEIKRASLLMNDNENSQRINAIPLKKQISSLKA